MARWAAEGRWLPWWEQWSLGAVLGMERRWWRLDLGGWLGWAIEHW